MNKSGKLITKKYTPWVWTLSIAIPIVVVILFMIKIPNVKPLTFLPPTYATINAITAVVLVSAYAEIKRKNRKYWHSNSWRKVFIKGYFSRKKYKKFKKFKK